MITKESVLKLISFIDEGLPNGVGAGGRGRMCVEHAISHAILGLNRSTYGGSIDRPSCVRGILVQISINLNDSPIWNSKKHRADGLRRFAIAQLGTAENFDEQQFTDLLVKRAQQDGYTKITPGWTAPFKFLTDKLGAKTGDVLADILVEMGTEGSKYLYLLDEDVPEPPKPVIPEVLTQRPRFVGSVEPTPKPSFKQRI